MAYIYMPLFFLCIGYALIYFALAPYLRIGSSLAGLVVGNAAPSFDSQLDSIFSMDSLPEALSEGETVDISLVQIPDYETQYGQFACDAIDLSVPLYYGDTDLVLDNGAGQFAGSYLPGFEGTTLVVAHNQTFFRGFEHLQVGDVFTITTNYGIYEYRINAMEVLRHDDPEAIDLAQTDEDILVAYTCYPFDRLIGFTQERLFVYAEKISGPEVVQP